MKRAVEVEFVVVLFTPVKFCKVLEPFTCRFESVVSPPVAVRVPVKLAVADIV